MAQQGEGEDDDLCCPVCFELMDDPYNVHEAVVADGETGEVLDEVDVQVTITDNPSLARRAVSTGGTLYALRYGPRLAPQIEGFQFGACVMLVLPIVGRIRTLKL